MSEPHAHPHLDVSGFEHTLTKKAGPLPVWAWGLGIGAVLVIFLYLHNRNSGSAAPVTAYDDAATMDGQDSDLSGSNAYDSGYQTGYAAGGGGGGTFGDPVSDPVVDATDTNPDGTASGVAKSPRNNASWLRRASAYLVASGTANPLRSSRILNRYLNGQPLTKQQRHVVNQAVKGTGLPPDVPQHVSTVTHVQKPTHHASADHGVQPHISNASAAGKPTPPKHLHHAAGVR